MKGQEGQASDCLKKYVYMFCVEMTYLMTIGENLSKTAYLCKENMKKNSNNFSAYICMYACESTLYMYVCV